MWIFWLPVVGLIAGGVAKLLVPRNPPLGCFPTMALGVVGSMVGGALGYFLFGKDLEDGAFQLSGLFGSVVGSIVVLLIWMVVQSKPSSGS